MLFESGQLLLMRVFQRGQLDLVFQLVFFRSLVLLGQRFVEGLGLFQVPYQLLNLERSKDDEIADTGYFKRGLFHRHTLRCQRKPVDDSLEVWLHKEADNVAHVLFHDGHFVVGAEQRGFAPVTFTGSLGGDLKLLWRASAWSERRLLRRIRGRPEVRLMLVECRRGYRSVGRLNNLSLLLLSQSDVVRQLWVCSILSTACFIILSLLVVGPANIR